MDKSDFAKLRAHMVDRHVVTLGVRSRRLLEAMRTVPREVFVPAALRDMAYEDSALVVADRLTLPAPGHTALMIDALELREGDKVLEAGTGTGYGAAVLSRMVASVCTVEPGDQPALKAASALAGLGCTNVHVLHANPVLGWPEQAPFDAIVVNAVGPQVPHSLRQQLRVGGRLVMPVGTDPLGLELVRVTRVSEQEYRTEDLADIRLSVLPATESDRNAGAALKLQAGPRGPVPGPKSDAALSRTIAAAGQAFDGIESADLSPLLQRIGDARVVLIGEATHGSSEFYRMRARITQALIRHKDFDFVAIEGDWPDAARIDHYVRHAGAPPSGWTAFARFPTWMWRNEETREFVDWLHRRNADAKHPVSFHGLDLYSLHHSMRAVLDYLDKVDPATAVIARERYACLTPWQADPTAYGHGAVTEQYASCEREVLATLSDLMRQRRAYAERGGERYLDAMQNARLVANAERYYRSMYYGSRAAWNLRDAHMFETLKLLLQFHGARSRCVVWAHNSHVGNSAATEMALRGEVNLGHLCRGEFGSDAYLIGFGTHAGTVAAASDWDGPMQVKALRESAEGSYERLFHDAWVANFMLPLRQPPAQRSMLEGLTPSRLQRAVGVIYRPHTERQSHYFQAVLPAQFDEVIWIDRTNAVTPLRSESIVGVPQTYPFSL